MSLSPAVLEESGVVRRNLKREYRIHWMQGGENERWEKMGEKRGLCKETCQLSEEGRER